MDWEIMTWMTLTMLNKRWMRKNKIDYLRSCYFVFREWVQSRISMDMMSMLRMRAIVKTVSKIYIQI